MCSTDCSGLAPVAEALCRPAGKISVGPVPLGTHLSSLFLQMHSPIISLISGSCTFSKLAGLMPCRDEQRHLTRNWALQGPHSPHTNPEDQAGSAAASGGDR